MIRRERKLILKTMFSLLGQGEESLSTHRGTQVFSQGGVDCIDLSFYSISHLFRFISCFTTFLDKKILFVDLLAKPTQIETKKRNYQITSSSIHIYLLFYFCTVYTFLSFRNFLMGGGTRHKDAG